MENMQGEKSDFAMFSYSHAGRHTFRGMDAPVLAPQTCAELTQNFGNLGPVSDSQKIIFVALAAGII